MVNDIIASQRTLPGEEWLVFKEGGERLMNISTGDGNSGTVTLQVHSCGALTFIGHLDDGSAELIAGVAPGKWKAFARKGAE